MVLAKRLATIDLLSKGRMRLLGIGVGSLPGEAAAVGVDYTTRGRRADEAIDALRLLWAGDENGVSFDGEFYSFASACSFPKPSSAAPDPHRRIEPGRGPPGRAARRRVLPRRPSHPRRASQPDRAHAGHRPGRGPRSRRAWRSPGWGSIDMTADDVAQEAARGVDRLVVGPASADPSEQRDQLTAFAERLSLR